MRVNKNVKRNILVFVILLFLIVCIFKFNKSPVFDIELSPISYDLSNKNNEEAYLTFLSNYIKPIELNNFIPYYRINIGRNWTSDTTGWDVIEYLKYQGYSELIKYLFSKTPIDYSKCAITKSFKKKFNDNLYHYFNLEGEEIDCHVSYDKKIIIDEYFDITSDGTPQSARFQKFHYIIDDEGNIEDIIYDGVSYSN